MRIKFIKPSYEFDMLGQTGIEKLKHIEKIARTCYKTEDKITNNSFIKLIKHLVDKKHHAMLEFAQFNMKLIVSRAFTHEIVRHRMSSFAQESQRYVGYGGAIEFIIPPWMDINPFECEGWYETGYDEYGYKYGCALPYEGLNYNTPEGAWISSNLESARNYNELLKRGWRPEQARDVLPNACKTEINVQTNLREWMHIFDLRAAPAAAPQMREIMISALADIKQLIPIVFDDI